MAAPYALVVELPLSLPAAAQAVREALAAEHVGVLSDVDVQATLRERLGMHTPPTHLLGLCDPVTAGAMLQAETDIAALLPCGCGLTELSPGRTRVALQDPRVIALLSDRPGVRAACERARATLVRVAQRLEALA